MYKRYLHLMQIHDFSYNYSDNPEVWDRENGIRTEILMLRAALSLTPRGRQVVTEAEKNYGSV